MKDEDTSRMPYQLPFPKDAQEEIVILDAGQNLAHEALLHWDFESVQANEVIDVTGKHHGRNCLSYGDSTIGTWRM